MRERLAKVFAVALGVLIAALAGVFAERQNALPEAGPDAGFREESAEGAGADDLLTRERPAAEAGASEPGGPEEAAAGRAVDPATVERGRAVFRDVGCTRCHRLEGMGSPRSPLDGVGARLAPEGIRAFVVGAPSVRDELSASVTRAKQRYGDLPPEDLEALVAYLASSRDR